MPPRADPPALACPSLPAAQLLEEGQRVHVAFTGEFGPHTTSPRHLTSEVRGRQPTAAGQPSSRSWQWEVQQQLP